MPFSPQLHAFLADRSAFCYALKDILESVAGFTSVRLPGDQSPLSDTVTMVDFKRQTATGERGLRPNLGDGQRQEYSLFTGRAEIVRGILRSANTPSQLVGCMTKLDEDEAKIRACLLRTQHYFTVGRLANFVVTDIIEDSPPTYGVDRSADKERDTLILPFTIQYERVMDNFPAS